MSQYHRHLKMKRNFVMDAVSASENTGVQTGSDVSLVISGIVEYVTTVVVTHFIPARTVDRQYFVSSAFCVLILELFFKIKKAFRITPFF